MSSLYDQPSDPGPIPSVGDDERKQEADDREWAAIDKDLLILHTQVSKER